MSKKKPNKGKEVKRKDKEVQKEMENDVKNMTNKKGERRIKKKM